MKYEHMTTTELQEHRDNLIKEIIKLDKYKKDIEENLSQWKKKYDPNYWINESERNYISNNKKEHDFMGIFGPKIGIWNVTSESDPKWDKIGEGKGYVTSGGPSEIYEWIKECEERYSKKPEDLKISFFKY